MRFKSLSLLIIVSFFSMGLTSGCASKYGAQTTRVERFPACYAPIQELREDESSVAKSTATGSLVGALGGALVGLMASGGKWQGAAVGGAMGAAAGSAVGYSQGKQKQMANENARMASYMRDLDGDISGLTASTASARMAIQCYQREFKNVIAQYKMGAISKIELESSYNEIRSGIEESERILGQIIDKAQNRDAEYLAAMDQESKVQGVSVPEDPSVSPAPKQMAISRMKSKQRTYSSSIREAEQVKQDVASTKSDMNNEFMARMAENRS